MSENKSSTGIWIFFSTLAVTVLGAVGYYSFRDKGSGAPPPTGAKDDAKNTGSNDEVNTDSGSTDFTSYENASKVPLKIAKWATVPNSMYGLNLGQQVQVGKFGKFKRLDASLGTKNEDWKSTSQALGYVWGWGWGGAGDDTVVIRAKAGFDSPFYRVSATNITGSTKYKPAAGGIFGADGETDFGVTIR